jgi:flagellar motor switch protein FliG
MEKMSREQVSGIQQLLEDIPHGESSPRDGIGLLAPIFESLDSDTRHDILARMNQESETLVSRILESFFFFEDILCFDDRGLQMILKEVDVKELSVALKGASEELKERIFSNVSNRVTRMIKDEMDYMGPVRMTFVKESQRRIIDIVRRLEREQQIVIVRRPQKGDDDVFV